MKKYIGDFYVITRENEKGKKLYLSLKDNNPIWIGDESKAYAHQSMTLVKMSIVEYRDWLRYFKDYKIETLPIYINVHNSEWQYESESDK